MAGPGRTINTVPTTAIGGVVTHRHPLEVGSSRLMGITTRLLARCRRALIRLDARDPDCHERVGDDWLAEYAAASQVHMKLLLEQRQRMQLVSGDAPKLSDSEYRAELEELARDAVLALPQEKLDQWLAERKVDLDPRATGSEVK